ncbi:cupin domain-containing protein [Kushneria phosphatilytica]|uniref:Cupin domain-containing protein n=1 Tax=Kushneria phosphatilytica TaxID=657387 RepID=A0A1S1NTG1_9GAMM|nr:cupin domain-containing protein [Kushneria phosphatilytica]OHV08709.1 cupin [Kushneria phosphatilytica]QEL12430.1 cupin domain-containing protein [Kushneria phosphatilytica]
MHPVITLDQLELEQTRQGALFESQDCAFAELIGLQGLGARYNEVAPGKSACPFHNHQVEDELFVILEGEGEYRFGLQRHPVGAGDVLGAPAGGTETAHQLINTGAQPLKYLAVSTRARAEMIEYPDSGKFLVKSHTPEGEQTRFVGRYSDERDYWEGEPGA